MYPFCLQCFGSGSAWTHIMGGPLDPDPHGQMPIWIQEVKHTVIKLKIAIKINKKKKEKCS